jgi:hypothetical protein
MWTGPSEESGYGYFVEQLPSILINLPDARARRRSSTRLMNRLGISHQFSPGETRFGKKRNVARAHINAMSLAPAEGPFMVLEDDLEFKMTDTVLRDVPDGTDILYRGVSQAGCMPRASEFRQIMRPRTCSGFVLSDDAGAGYVRLYSMISAHAILYLTERGRKAYQRAQEISDRRELALDISYADIMPQLKVHAVKAPAFAENMDLQIRNKRNEARELLTHSWIAPVQLGQTRTVEHDRYQLTAEVRRDGATGGLFWHALDLQVYEPVNLRRGEGQERIAA